MSILLNAPSLWKNRDKIQNTIELAQNLIDNEGFSIERALTALGVPEEKRSYYSEKLKEVAAG